MATRGQWALQQRIDQREAALLKSLTEAQKAVRHKCFVSYHHVDESEAVEFIETFKEVFIPRALGVSDEDDFIESDDTDYVMEQIRERYLVDSTVTIVLVGKCTWARRYIDWEVYSTLRNDKNNKRSGLVAVTLHSASDYHDKKLPPRVADNVNGKEGYARWYKYPTTKTGLKNMIEEAFLARNNKADRIDNTRARKMYNSTCP